MQTVLEPFRRRHKDVELVFKECYQDDLRQRLDSHKIDIAFLIKGVRDSARRFGSWEVYEEPLFFLPKNPEARSASSPIRVEEIAEETFAHTGEGCGLTQAVHDLFRNHRRKLIEYRGQAVSYKALAEWANLGIAAAILPQSKLTSPSEGARPLITTGGLAAKIAVEAVWQKDGAQTPHIRMFVDHLKKTVPGILQGLAPRNENRRPPTQADYSLRS